VNDSLKLLSDEVRVVNYVSEPSAPYRLINVQYRISVEEDHLAVDIRNMDIYLKDNAASDTTRSGMRYKASLADIGKITFVNELRTPRYGDPFYDTSIEVEAVGDEELFDMIYDDGTVRNTWHIPIRVYKHSDSLIFQQMANLLNRHILPDGNRRAATCKEDKRHEWSGKLIEAIDNEHVEVPISLNGKACQEKDIHRLVLEYLKEQNLRGLLGYVVIDESNELQTIWTEQNNFHHLQKAGGDSTPGMRVMMAEIGTMTDEQLGQIRSILSAQEWAAGKCNGEPVRSYVDIAIKNQAYKRPVDEE
ncbi:MAG: hypothetical protein AAFV25_22405, partial [Bacteroidota bacterium]